MNDTETQHGCCNTVFVKSAQKEKCMSLFGLTSRQIFDEFLFIISKDVKKDVYSPYGTKTLTIIK